MAYKWIFPILVITNVCCETNSEHHKQTRSLPASKTPRFNILSGNFEDQHSPENYFPDIEYPKDIFEVAKPFYFQASDDVVLEPFPRDVKETFKLISSGGKTVEEPVFKPARKPARPILKTSSTLLSTWTQKHKKNTVSLDKINTTNVLIENKDVNSVEGIEHDNINITSTENNNAENVDSHEIPNSTEDILTINTTNVTLSSQEINEESQEAETSFSSEESVDKK